MDNLYPNEELNVEKRIQDYCALLDSVIKVIKKPRRTEIIKVIYNEGKPVTFNEIQERTKIPTGSLYNHLNKLFLTGVINKTDERPAKYFLTKFTMELLGLPKKDFKSRSEKLDTVKAIQE